MDRDEMKRLLIEHTDAWNSHDVDRLIALFADDCVFEASAGPEFDGRRFEGRAQVRAAFADVFDSMPDANWGDGRLGTGWDQVVDHDAGEPAHVDLSSLEMDLSR